MSVNFNDVQAESPELVWDGIGAHDVGDAPVNLQAVIVDDHTEVVQLVVVRKHHRLPNLPLFDFTVAKQSVNTEIFAQVFGPQRHTRRCGDALSQGTG